MNAERHTEVDGLDATWRLAHHKIEIVNVHKADGQDVTFKPGTDLADARELYERWNRLWDKIKDEFWAEIAPRPRRSSDTRWCGEQAKPNW